MDERKNWGTNNDGKQFEFPTPFYLPNYLVVYQSIHLEHPVFNVYYVLHK